MLKVDVVQHVAQVNGIALVKRRRALLVLAQADLIDRELPAAKIGPVEALSLPEPPQRDVVVLLRCVRLARLGRHLKVGVDAVADVLEIERLTLLAVFACG